MEADIEHNGRFDVIWNGAGLPEHTQYLWTGVTTGEFYQFRHKVLNQNGESPYSDVFVTWACELPSKPQTPTWITSSETSISIQWAAPTDDGGCPVREYRILRNAGDDSTPETFVHASDLEDLFYQNDFEVTDFPVSSVGNRF